MAKKKSKSSTKSAAAPAKSAAPAPAKKTSQTFLVSPVAAPAASAAPVVAAPPAATSADVSARAHQIWIARGKPTPGTPLADWLQAERELGIRKS